MRGEVGASFGTSSDKQTVNSGPESRARVIISRGNGNVFASTDPGGAHLKEALKKEIILNLSYARELGVDRAEIADWAWPY